MPLRDTDYFDPVDLATSFMLNYASGTWALACRFMGDDYGRSEAQAGNCTGWVDNERLPVVTLVDSCELADQSYRVRFAVVPGVGATPLPFVGIEQHVQVGVSPTKQGYFGVDAPPTAYEPGTGCTDKTS